MQSFVHQYNAALIRYGTTAGSATGSIYGLGAKTLKGKQVLKDIGNVKRFQSQLSGGMRGAIDFFHRLTGQTKPVFDTTTHRYILRGSSTGKPTVEVINKTAKTLEKIRFLE